jgi:hypothetical protein
MIAAGRALIAHANALIAFCAAFGVLSILVGLASRGSARRCCSSFSAAACWPERTGRAACGSTIFTPPI